MFNKFFLILLFTHVMLSPLIKGRPFETVNETEETSSSEENGGHEEHEHEVEFETRSEHMRFNSAASRASSANSVKFIASIPPVLFRGLNHQYSGEMSMNSNKILQNIVEFMPPN
uniref:Uncharacterized protein n=1 Tax=Globodera rostochiensis TaxID=31243 RepID=A0A914HML2_GLORO